MRAISKSTKREAWVDQLLARSLLCLHHTTELYLLIANNWGTHTSISSPRSLFEKWDFKLYPRDLLGKNLHFNKNSQMFPVYINALI